MKCPACSGAGFDHDEIIAKCKSNPYWTGKLLVGFDLLSPSLHRALAEWLVNKIKGGKRRFIILTPRDHYKTTLFGISTILWFIINDPNIRILYMMSSCPEAAKKLDVVKHCLVGSEQLAHYFPDFVPDLGDYDTKWTQDYIRLPVRTKIFPEGTVEARGLTSNVTGGHFNVHIFDDLIDETMVNSAIEQQKAVDFVKRSDALFAKLSEDIEIIIGTRWPGPFYDWLLDESGIADEYETLVIGCYVDDRFREFMSSIGKEVLLEDGSVIFPEQFDRESLDLVRKKAGEYDFSHQWLNIRTTEDEQRFRAEDFMTYRYNFDKTGLIDNEQDEVLFRDLHRTLTIDPATGEGHKSDKSAVTVCGYDRKTGKIYVLDAWHARVLTHGLVKKTLDLAQKWDVSCMCPEDVAYQKVLKHFLEQEKIKRKIFIPIKPVKPGGKGKGARILDALQPFVRNHQLFVRKAEHQDLIRELTDLHVVAGKVVGRSPNLADALAYHAVHWKWRNKPGDDEYDGVKIWTPDSDVVPSYGLECLT